MGTLWQPSAGKEDWPVEDWGGHVTMANLPESSKQGPHLTNPVCPPLLTV